jgi:5-bromo-4-chloroindolyl phosphate hydrolysis protein
MQRPLREHITFIEQKIETLKAKLASAELSETEKRYLTTDLGIAERALAHFKKGL